MLWVGRRQLPGLWAIYSLKVKALDMDAERIPACECIYSLSKLPLIDASCQSATITSANSLFIFP